ncbi:MAG: hypothetical protein ABJD11_03560 [Gemmatimonadota bacterium]
MRVLSAVALLLSLPCTLIAQAPAPLRQVTGGALVSKSDPAAAFVVDSAFHYVGGQVIDILRVAGAEQHFFVDAAPNHSIRRFWWLQFEHYYPENNYTYDYSGLQQEPVVVGSLAFMGDVRARPHYFTMDDRPGSDSKAAENYLRAHGYSLEGTFVTLRLFHLPDASRRRELMLIYGEVLPDGAPEQTVASAIKGRARASISIR